MHSPPCHVKRSGRVAAIVAQESAEPFVTFDCGIRAAKTTTISVATYFLNIRNRLRYKSARTLIP